MNDFTKLISYMERVNAVPRKTFKPGKLTWVGRDTFRVDDMDGNPILFGGRSFYNALRRMKT